MRYPAIAISVFVTLAILGATVHAQEETKAPGTGFYAGGHFGLNTASGSEIDGGTIPIDHDPLIGFGGVLGYDFGIFRVDGEIAFRINEATRLGGTSLKPGSSSSRSSTSAFSFMVNGYFDIPTNGPVKPYIGGGIGFATVAIDWKAPGFFVFTHTPVADDSDSGLAYQFSAGLGFEVNPRITWSFGFRHFVTEDMQMTFDGASPINAGLPFTMKYQSNEFNLGIRITTN